MNRIVDPVAGETVVLATTAAGLRVRVLPRPHLREVAAVLTFGYGSTDLAFADAAGNAVTTPAGTAHYLEHKLFEDEELAVFQRFAQRGASVNAQTGFTRTTYHFHAADRLRDNLQDLLRLCARPHITQQNVDKERGIIAEEVRMYEDSPGTCAVFSLLAAMYPQHPVRHTVGGTVESIAAITPAILLQCWQSFYRTGNAALAVAGPVDVQEVLDLAEAAGLAAGAPPARATLRDFGPPGEARTERALPVARTKLLFGIKERRAADDAAARLRRAIAANVVLDRLFASSSELREAMHRRGDVDDSLGAGYMGERTFALATVGCDTDEPERAEQALRQALFAEVAFDQDHLERLRRRQLGQFVRGCESVRSLAFAHAQEELEGLEPFLSLRVLEALGLGDLEATRAELLRADNLTVAVARRG